MTSPSTPITGASTASAAPMTLKDILADSLHSHYINDDYYALLRDDLAEWNVMGTPLDQHERNSYEALILHEHWLLDRRALEDWYQLYTDQCVYWIPAAANMPDAVAGNPQNHVTIAFDDRRRMGDRIVWLRTGVASAQLPVSNTNHSNSGFVRVPTARTGEIKIRSQFVMHEIRAGHPMQTLSGWMGHVLVARDGKIKIDRKLVCLVDADRARHNPTFLI